MKILITLLILQSFKFPFFLIFQLQRETEFHWKFKSFVLLQYLMISSFHII